MKNKQKILKIFPDVKPLIFCNRNIFKLVSTIMIMTSCSYASMTMWPLTPLMTWKEVKFKYDPNAKKFNS